MNPKIEQDALFLATDYPATEFSVQALADILFNHFALAENTQFVVAYSGGCDSQVLLHGLVGLRKQSNITLMAAHFDHALQAQSAGWAKQCERWCDECETRFVSVRRVVDCEPGASLEACARDARYQWLDEISKVPQVVLSAHHADDQAETFLLHLFQGKEIAQLGGIAPTRSLLHSTQTRLIRPLLGFSRAQLLGYARKNKLQWLDDPMNQNLRFYRNYIRHALLPMMSKRSPNLVSALNRAADSCRRIAEHERAELSVFYERCCCPKLRGVFCLTAPLNVNAPQCAEKHHLIGLIRYWIHHAGYDSPTNGQLLTLYRQIVEQQATQASLVFNDLAVRYYHHHLYLTKVMPPRTCLKLEWNMQTINIADYAMTVEMIRVASGGIDRYALQGKKIHLVWRKKNPPSERVRLPHRQHHCTLKKLFQARRMPPWERDYLPFLTVDNEIVWVHGIGVLDGYMAASGNIGVCPQFSRTK